MKTSILILILLILLLFLTTSSRTAEAYSIDCKFQPADVKNIPQKVKLGLADINTLNSRCAAFVPKAEPGDSEDSVFAQERKCMTSCYPGKYLNEFKQPVSVCEDLCTDPNSKGCLDCVMSFHCQQSASNEIPLPCQYSGVLINKPSESTIHQMVEEETDCYDECEDASSQECKQCHALQAAAYCSPACADPNNEECKGCMQMFV
jgi:hypothetical protein